MDEERKEESPAPWDLVVVGSSAGGIEALGVLLGSLTPDFPAPIVLAQHLDPNRPSMLAPTLERRSPLPIEIVQDASPLKPGTVYVVPANRHVTIDDGFVRLESDHAERPRPSVDLLLTSAARWYGERLIAVILTGSGSDGAAGAVEVKNAGGTVIIQNPATARYPSMPAALPPTSVDHVADLERIGPLLRDLVAGTGASERIVSDSPMLDDILRTVSLHSSLDFRHYKPTTIMRRIGRRMAVTHHHDLPEYAQYLKANPEEIGELTMAFLIKVTEFFRDPEAFDYLKEHVLPELVERGRARGRVLRIWSAGCATGEEPYSVAILLADMLGAELPEWSVKIFATDLDDRAIDFARRGLYPASALKNSSDEIRTRYFERADGGVRVTKQIRQLVIFGQQNLSRAVPFPRIDLIVCRNLLIYFKPDLQQQILDSFAYSLTRHGYLFLGKAETVRPSKAIFDLVEKRWKIYQCTNCPLGGPDAARAAVGFEARRVAASRAEEVERTAHEGAQPTDIDIGQLRRFNEAILRLLPVGIVIIDRHYRIVTINGTARRILGIHELANDQDFLHTVRGLPYARVRAAIDSAFRERSQVSLAEIEMEPVSGADGQYLNFSIVLTSMAGIPAEHGGPDLAVISVLDATEQLQARRRLEVAQAEQAQLADDLGTANKRLADLNSDLQDANEELQAANEELMLTQEELQASNEEFEATNEELQATNEELETNNEELQATNEELETTNDELNARTHDLQQMARELDLEQSRLGAVIDMAPFAVTTLRGPQLTVQSLNDRARPLFKMANPLGQPFDEVFRGAEPEGFGALIWDAYRKDGAHSVRVKFPGSGGARHEMDVTIVPTRDESAKVDGVVVYAWPAGDGPAEGGGE